MNNFVFSGTARGIVHAVITFHVNWEPKETFWVFGKMRLFDDQDDFQTLRNFHLAHVNTADRLRHITFQTNEAARVAYIETMDRFGWIVTVVPELE